MTEAKMIERVHAQARAAKKAYHKINGLSGQRRTALLERLAELLQEQQENIIAANAIDAASARQSDLDQDKLARMLLTTGKLESMVKSVLEIARQDDPVGRVIEGYVRPNGLRIEKRLVPIGVIAFIVEARPNVLVDVFSLCMRSGNACVFRGGKEAITTNRTISESIVKTLTDANIDSDIFQFISETDHAAVRSIVTAEGLIDLAIPRGGKDLIAAVKAHATIPVIGHYNGVCHVYIHKAADVEIAVRVAVSAKTDGIALCNTAECFLIDEAIAHQVLPLLAVQLKEREVEIRGDDKVLKLIEGAVPATDKDWGREYLAKIVAIRVVPGIDEAIDHITRYGSSHTDAIITNDLYASQKFVAEVDSSAVMVNASTRFNDGGEFGLGAEVGISTSKLPPRGPMGARDLCTYKWVVVGDGQIRA